jgi:hypothetical protein
VELIGAGGAVNGAVHAAAAGQTRIGGVDDRIDVERCDVTRLELDS